MDGVFADVDGYQVIRFITGWAAGAFGPLCRSGARYFGYICLMVEVVALARSCLVAAQRGGYSLYYVWAVFFNASSNIPGSFLPLFRALLSMPEQAVALK